MRLLSMALRRGMPICSTRTGLGVITEGAPHDFLMSATGPHLPSCFLILDPRIMLLNAWIALLLITSSTNGFDGSMMNGLQSLPQWQTAFNHPGSSMLGLLNAIQNIGGLVGLPFTPYLADGMGRRVGVLLGAGIMVRPLSITFVDDPITEHCG